MPLSWPYHFLSLSRAEVQQRRDVLTLRGHYAQYSALAVIVFISIYTRLSKKNSPQQRGTRSTILGKESIHDSDVRTTSGTDRSGTHRQGISWWDLPPVPGWKETRKQYLLSLSWLAWLLILSVWRTGNDYLHLTKALGHVALAQLPFQILQSPTSFLFASNPGLPSILSIVTSISQPVLSPYHRLFGRLIILPLLFAHAVLYLLFFAQSSHPDFGTLLAKRVRDLDVQVGLVGLVLAICILFFRRPTVQRTGSQRRATPGVVSKNRRTFYVVHLLSVAGLLAAAYFHVIYARTFVLESLGLFAVSVGCCWAMAVGKRGSIAKNPH